MKEFSSRRKRIAGLAVAVGTSALLLFGGAASGHVGTTAAKTPPHVVRFAAAKPAPNRVVRFAAKKLPPPPQPDRVVRF